MSKDMVYSRRRFLEIFGAASVGASIYSFGGGAFSSPVAMAEESVESMTADKALKKLMDGNNRFVESMKKGPRRTIEYRKEVAEGQTPFAAILACADSRVAPEIIFDQGIGDLFVVRVAGNIVNPTNYGIKGSLEFGVLALGASLIVVLGHSQCGAVAGAIEALQKGTEFPGSIQDIVTTIKPAVDIAKKEKGDLLHNSIVSNVKLGVSQLRESDPVISPMVKEGKVQVVGANYDLNSGVVEIVT